MLKRYLKWMLPVALLSVVLANLVMRPDFRALFSLRFWENLQRYSQVMRLVESEYVHADDVSYQALTDSALKQAVHSLDRYSRYMSPDDFEDYNMASNQAYVGVGIRIAEFSHRVSIAEVFSGGSAEAAGMQPGDLLIAIDGEDVRGQTLNDVSEQIRGESGSLVRLTVSRQGMPDSIDFELERRAITLDAVVDVGMRTDSIGYMKLRQFTDSADEEILEGLRRLEKAGMKALVLDLRENPGGRLDTAARVAELFLEQGQTIVTIEARRGIVEEIRAAEPDQRFEQEVVILIDNNSASASEIVAGALRDHGRAVLVGEQSFGKGSVQSVFSFRDGYGLKLTSARYLLPEGEAINGTGVAPDVAVTLTDEERYTRYLQEHHLRAMDETAFTRRFGFPPVEDRPLNTALNLLSGALY
ncbi:MAG: S41 family peptidase [Coraliomargarita sp.]